MAYHYDQFAKQIGRRALDQLGVTVAHAEIAPEVQYADLQHEPDPARSAEREQLGLLGQLASVSCLIEVYSGAPDGDELRACLGKHIAFWRQRTRRAYGDLDELANPFLWIITARVPTTVLNELSLEAAPGWLKGVYLLGGNVLRAGIVTASKLPKERATLLVRLMAAGPLLSAASAELFALPAEAHERAVAERGLVRLYQALAKKPNRDPDEEEFMETMYETMEQYRAEGLVKGHVMGRAEGRVEGRVEGRAEGRAEGLADALLTVLQGRSIAVPDPARERIRAEKDPARLTRWLERAGVATSIDDLFGGGR